MDVETVRQRRDGFISAGYDSMVPPNAKDVPLPQNLVDSSSVRKHSPRVFYTPWAGRTPCKNQHRNKALEGIQEIVEDSDEMATAGSRKTEAKSTKRQRIKKKDSIVEIDKLETSITLLPNKNLEETNNIASHNEMVTSTINKMSNMPEKRSNLYCTTCHKPGHSTLVCYRNQDGKDVIRCYNCGKIGHLAVRCTASSPNDSSSVFNPTPPKEETKSKSGKKRSKAAKLAKKNAETEKSNDEDLKREITGIALICKIMADRPLREETQRCQPQLFDEMLSIMLENITFPQL